MLDVRYFKDLFGDKLGYRVFSALLRSALFYAWLYVIAKHLHKNARCVPCVFEWSSKFTKNHHFYPYFLFTFL